MEGEVPQPLLDRATERLRKPSEWLRDYWWVLLLATLAGGVVLALVQGTEVVPLELAGDQVRAAEVLAEYVEDDLVSRVERGVGLDFLWVVLYVATAMGAALWAAHEYWVIAGMRRLGPMMAVSALFAGVADWVENVGLLAMLGDAAGAPVVELTDAFYGPMLAIAESLGVTTAPADGSVPLLALSASVTASWPVITAAAAWAKFFLIGAAVLYALPAVAAWLWRGVSHWVVGRPSVATRPRLRDNVRVFLMQDLTRPEPWPSDSQGPPSDEAPVPGRIGIGLSGGGVRSASFALGALQRLRFHGILDKAEYLTAVSGGAYTAMAWASAGKPDLVPEALRSGTPEERYIRNRSSWLAPTAGLKVRLVGRLLLGIGVNAVFLALVLYLVARPVGWLVRMVYGPGANFGRGVDVPAASGWAVAVPLAQGVAFSLLSLFPRLTAKRVRTQQILRGARVMFTIGGVLAAVHVVVPALLWAVDRLGEVLTPDWLSNLSSDDPALVAVAVGGGIVGLVAKAVVDQLKKAKPSVLAMVVAVAVVPLTALWGFLVFVRGALVGPRGNASFLVWMPIEGWLWLGLLAGFTYFVVISDQTTWSLHPVYKERLASTFSVERVSDELARQVDYDKPQFLTKTTAHIDAEGERWRPQLVVCGAVNVSEHGVTSPGRRALSFTFSSDGIGSPNPLIGTVGTRHMECNTDPVRHRDVTLPAATAISGAAFSPAMGKATLLGTGLVERQAEPFLRAIMAIANARLGVWLPNPQWFRASGLDDDLGNGDDGFGDPVWWERPRATYLLKEIFGVYSVDDKFVYVTDGGHWDNLGMVELLRRGCAEIYCIDASGGDPGVFNTIGEAIAFARTELNVEIDIDLEQIRIADRDAAAAARLLAVGDLLRRGGWFSRSRALKAMPFTITAPEGDSGADEPATGTELMARCVVVGTTRFWRYRDEGDNPIEGKLVYVQAAVTKDANWAIRSFHEKVTAFPNHSTANQWFNDEEFEAYRELGAWAATQAATEMGYWQPR